MMPYLQNKVHRVTRISLVDWFIVHVTEGLSRNITELICSRRREGLMRRERREAVLVALVTVFTLDA